MIYGIVLATLYEWAVWVDTTEPMFENGQAMTEQALAGFQTGRPSLAYHDSRQMSCMGKQKLLWNQETSDFTSAAGDTSLFCCF